MAKKQKKNGRHAVDSGKTTYRVLMATARLVAAVLLAVLLYLAVVGGYQMGYQLFSDAPYGASEGVTVTFTVDAGESTAQVAQELEESGLIESALIFRLQSLLFQTRIVAGTYQLGDGMSSREILRILGNVT